MRTFWDPAPTLGGPLIHDDELAANPPQIAARNAALQRQCVEIGKALDNLERLKGTFREFLAPVSELAREFEACSDRLEQTTARLAALE